MRRFILVLILLAFACAPAQALPLVVDYTGFSWSEIVNGQPATFSAVGIIDGFSESVDLADEVYTYSLGDLGLTQVTTLSTTTKRYDYAGGNFDIYRSTGPANRPFDYGTNPSNGTAPATFVDGVEWLGGSLTKFSVVYNSALNLGTMSAEGQFSRGEFSGALAENTWFSFAGLTARPGNGIPAGYSYRVDGQITAELATTPPVPEPSALVLLGGGVLGLAIGLRRRRV